tara:strand:+ start:3627 stop:4301 length:675 start_codon:yes stop_codon:yes gene_type:complete
MWWLKPVISGAIGMIGANQQKAPPKYKRTEAEQSMVNSLQDKMRDGFDVDARVRQQTRPLFDASQHSKDQAMGRAISSGMQNSIITDELMRKVDRNTQERVTSISEQIAIQNQQYKDQAEGNLNNFIMNEGNAQRQSDAQQTQFQNQKRQAQWGAFGDMVGGLVDASPIGGAYNQAMQSNEASPMATNSAQRKVQIMQQMSQLDPSDAMYIQLNKELKLIEINS